MLVAEIEFAESKKQEAPTEAEKAEWQAVDNLDSEELPFNF